MSLYKFGTALIGQNSLSPLSQSNRASSLLKWTRHAHVASGYQWHNQLAKIYTHN